MARAARLKNRVPFAIRHRARSARDAIVEAPARAAAATADAGSPISRAYRDWYLRRQFLPLRALLPTQALVFDVGANIGMWTDVLRGFGCRVVALEPNSDCVARLRRRFGDDGQVHVVAAAISDTAGDVDLFVAGLSEHSTTSRRWIDDMVARAGFDADYWRRTETVHAVTLDQLIGEFGEPDYLKLDVEGSELAALRGLSRPIRLVSFETHGATEKDGHACFERLSELAEYEFNLMPGDVPRPLWPEWRDGPETIAALDAQPQGWHNVIARKL